jgi:hypothetical protein
MRRFRPKRLKKHRISFFFLKALWKFQLLQPPPHNRARPPRAIPDLTGAFNHTCGSLLTHASQGGFPLRTTANFVSVGRLTSAYLARKMLTIPIPMLPFPNERDIEKEPAWHRPPIPAGYCAMRHSDVVILQSLGPWSFVIHQRPPVPMFPDIAQSLSIQPFSLN